MAGSMVMMLGSDPEEEDAPILLKARLFDHVLDDGERSRIEADDPEFIDARFHWTDYGDEDWPEVSRGWVQLGGNIEP